MPEKKGDMTEQEMVAILAGEREADLTAEEAEQLEAFLETERGRELLAQAERELDPLAEAYDPELPAAEAWVRVDQAIRAELDQAEEARQGRLVVTPLQAPARAPNWGGTLLLAAALLFAAALTLAVVAPGRPPDTGGKGGGTEAAMTTPGGEPAVRPSAGAVLATEPLSLTPQKDVELKAPAATIVQVEPGQGYVARTETKEGALLIVTVRERADDDEPR